VTTRCPLCGAEVRSGTACSRCLLQLGLGAADDVQTATETEPQTANGTRDWLPDSFGVYRPIGVLGEGGMGIVYLAEQEQPVRRRVALKVIKEGMDTRRVIARFESERQALALMDHPNIAHVYDAGVTPDGRPYFVMEYVPGTPITDYCDKYLLGPRERLELFIQVCHAVHHAHQKGVIHRDIKPPNVLVMIRDGQPVPKVIDFGVAKATHQRLTEKTLYTEFGTRIGTPAYMSPEQAERTGLDVDTATDIYSLGVVLYELLVGALPFDPQALRRAGYEEVGRIIREDDPPRPTVKLQALGPTATEIARRRHMDVRSLERFLRGDPDWITMKALEKDRTRRYASASEFAADITRHLHHEVVVARPPSLGYRASRFVRKHRGAVAAAAAVFFMLALGFAVSTVFFFRSEAARREAERQREAARRQSYLATIATADADLQGGAVAAARRRLDLVDPALRGWEWRYLYSKADSSLASIGATGPVSFVAFSPDQSRVFWITQYGVVHAADTATHRPIPPLTRPAVPANVATQPAYIVAISPDGSRLLSSAWKALGFRPGHIDARGFGMRSRHRPVSDDDVNVLSLTGTASGTLLRRFLVPDMGTWILPQATLASAKLSTFTFRREGITDPTGAWLATMSGGGEPVSAVFSPDGRRFATWAWDNVLRVWDAESGAPIAVFTGHADGISSAAFSPDGRRIVSGSYDGTTRIWAVGGTPTVLAGHEGAVTAVAFAPDGGRVASGGVDKVVRISDVTGHSLATLTGHSGRVTTLAFAPTGHELVSGSEDRTIRLWDTLAFAAQGVLKGHTDAITSVAVSSDGRRIVSGSADQTLRFWDPPAARFDGIVATTGGDVRQVVVSRDSSRLAVAHDDSVRILSLVTASPPIVCTREPFPSFSKNIAFTPDGSRLVSTYRVIRVWDPLNCNTLATWPLDRSKTAALAISPDGRRFAIGQRGGTLEVWDLTSRRLIWQTDQARTMRAVAYTPDGTRIIASADRDVRVWNADRPTVVLTMIGHEDNVTALAVSPDGRWIASGSNDHTVRLWSATTGELAGTLTGYGTSVDAVAFSPDSTRVVSAGGDHTLWLWDVITHLPILVLQGHQGAVTSVTFTPDGTRIVSGSTDGTVRVWDGRLARDPSTDARADDPSVLNEQSWRTAKTAGLPSSAYDLALRRAVVANEAAPWDAEFVGTLGALYYRLRRYDESLSTLIRAAGLRAEPSPDDWLFIAMAHHQLRHGAEAREALNRVRTMLAADQGRRRLTSDSSLKALDDEAVALIDR
jgi:eukaryotic-like serine/threonine-protein kinase